MSLHKTDNSIKSKPGKEDTVRGFLSYFYGNFVVLILGFIQTPLLTRILSTGEYGKTGMFETAVSVIYIFAIMGLDQAYIRFYYGHKTSGDTSVPVDRGILLRRCITPSLIAVTFLSLVYIISSEPVNIFLFGESSPDVTALVIVYTYISVLERFFFLDVRMQQNGRLYSNINIIEKVLSILTIIVLFFLRGDNFRIGLYALAIPWGTTTTYLIIRYFVINRASATGKPGSAAREADRGYSPSFRELISYGLPFITVLLMEWALSSCDRVALRMFSGFEETGIYGSAMKIIILLITFKNTFIAYWSPVAMKRFESGVTEENKAFFRKAYEMVVFLCITAAVTLILLRKVIVMLLGPSYRSAERVIPFLTLMPVFAIMFEITNQSIKFTKRGRYLNIASLAALVTNITGNLLLVPRLGSIGAAMTTGISYMIYFAIGSYFAEKCIRIGYDHKKTALYALLAVLYCVEASFASGTVRDLVCGGVVLAVIFFIERDKIRVIGGYVKRAVKKP
ncbi:MAG: lipopolysaccharide biosynthesis protein [Lachnospiraceae bacterium]|nr:lipopolysaccharide biosynthesis protein [Lachnospiraceae bacterium]